MIPRQNSRRFLLVLVCLLIACAIRGATTPVQGDISFNHVIRPILSDRCFACHGPDAGNRKAKLRLDRADGPDGAYRSRYDVIAIKPGSLDESEVWWRIITDDQDEIMPPRSAHKKPLSAEEIEAVKGWIEAGAPYEAFWSFVPVKMPPAPAVKNEGWSPQRIDRYVLARLETAGLAPADEAGRRTLIRRVTFDLTGLPPTLEEIRNFLADSRPGAYETLVDGLMARKQYGEHMARYWLDLVRFADTNGMHKDFYRNFIAYRDWVIRAFNDNLGYDDFVRYQLAGDLFPGAGDDQLVASAFNRLHLIIDRGTALPEESFYKNVVDRVTAVGTAFMGMTVQCAACHDHKYDPITQKDFYSLYAFFNNIDAQPETVAAPKNGLQPPFVVIGPPEKKKELQALNQELAKIDARLKQLEKDANAEKDPEKKKALAQESHALTAQKKALTKKRNTLDASLQRAMVMKERSQVRPTHVMIRGQYDAPGEEVTRNTPGFLPPLKKKDAMATRLDLAEWFVQRQHPLTARVAVNRFWQQFFGVGLVKTSEDFGSQSDVPSHPALLDYLADSFMASGWDIKALVKQMVMSRTYRQSSVATPEAFKQDPENRLLRRGSRFRMDAEMIRDQVLATSGLLSPAMYGRSVKPPQPEGLWKAVTMTGERFTPDTGEAIYRRSVYTFWKRAMPPPQMTILNAPNRDACIARRERTNTPSQALLLLNEGEYMKAGRHLAQHLLKQEGLDAARRIDLAYETITCRLPDAKERAVLLELLQDLKKRYGANQALADDLCRGVKLERPGQRIALAAWTVLINTLYNLDITKTRA